MKSSDTQREANQVLLKLIRKKTYADKVYEIFDAYSTGRLLAMAGIRQRYPEATDREVWEKWAQQHLGATLYKEVYGNISKIRPKRLD
jgi:hypothetical protein